MSLSIPNCPTVADTFKRVNDFSGASKAAFETSDSKMKTVESAVSYHLASRVGYVGTALFAAVASVANVALYAFQGLSNQTLGRFTDQCKFDTDAQWKAVTDNKDALQFSLRGLTFGHVDTKEKPHGWGCTLSFGLFCTRKAEA